MLNAVEILKEEVISGDVFYTLKDSEGVNSVSESSMIDLIRNGVQFYVDLDNEQYEALSLIQLEYAEVATNLDGEELFDVYAHDIDIEDGAVKELVVGGKHLKEFKTERGALNYAHKHFNKVVEVM